MRKTFVARYGSPSLTEVLLYVGDGFALNESRNVMPVN